MIFPPTEHFLKVTRGVDGCFQRVKLAVNSHFKLHAIMQILANVEFWQFSVYYILDCYRHY